MTHIKTLILLIPLVIFFSSCIKETNEIENEPSPEIIALTSLDMFAPSFYLMDTDPLFIEELNTFLEHVYQENLLHPLDNGTGIIPSFSIPAMGAFGAGKGPTNTEQHHPAVDIHFDGNQTQVQLFAVMDGFVNTYTDADKYRHYISITKPIQDENGNQLGKLVVLYAHVDLDLDQADALNINGTTVQKGALISKNLYAATVGGPHLHFEIRYYRANDIGTESFYGFMSSSSPDLTDTSKGQWQYGVWNPTVGYGFGDPKSFGLDL